MAVFATADFLLDFLSLLAWLVGRKLRRFRRGGEFCFCLGDFGLAGAGFISSGGASSIFWGQPCASQSANFACGGPGQAQQEGSQIACKSGAFSRNSLHGCRVPLAFLATNFDLINASYLPR
ncbi:MAG: hypothetical protein WA716_10310 [Pseudolabrys sp.]